MRVAPYLEEYRVRVAPFTVRVRVAPFTIRTVVYPHVKRVRVAPFTRTRTVTPPCVVHQTPWGPYRHCPKPYTVTEDVFNYEERPVYGYKDVFNYENRPSFNYETRKRSVFNDEKLTEDVFNYETRKRSVFYYETLTEDVFNYEWQDRPVTHTHPTPCPADRFDPSTGACWPDPASCKGTTHTHNGSACHERAKSHEGECGPGTELQGHSDCVPVPKPTSTAAPKPTATAKPKPKPKPTPTPVIEEPSGVGLECTQAAGGFALSASWTLPAGARAYWRWLNGMDFIGYGTLSAVSGATQRVGEAGEYSVQVQARYPGDKQSGWVASAVAVCSPLTAPANMSAACSAGGVLSVSWKHQGPLVPLGLQFDVEVDGAVVGSVNYRSLPGRAESYSYSWDGAHSNKAHRVRVRVAPSPAGVASGEDRESAWTLPVTASKCAVFKPTGFTTASCNSHGVVHLKWNPVNGADRYDLKNTAPGEESINYEGPGTEVYAQRWEGETYKIRIRARARTGQKWSGWTAAETVTCDPLAPVLLTANRALNVSPHWASPNGSWVNLNPGRQWIAPQVLRYMPDDTKDQTLGRDNCTETRRNDDDDGWTRTCTFHWTEPLAVRLDEATAKKLSHPAQIDHSLTSHLHMDADGDPTTTPHRHCKTTAGTCPGPDDPNAPDLAWHSPLPDLDDNFWTEQVLVNGISGAASIGGASYVAAALAGANAGAPTVVGAVVGFVVGVAAAWLWQNNVEEHLYLVMNASTGCLDLSLGGGPRWQSGGSDATEVEYTLEEGGYETKVVHEIAHCVKVG